MKSNMTRRELQAQAMLLGKFYDHRAHVFQDFNMATPSIDADTLEVIPEGLGMLKERAKMVSAGGLGASDGPFVTHTK